MKKATLPSMILGISIGAAVGLLRGNPQPPKQPAQVQKASLQFK